MNGFLDFLEKPGCHLCEDALPVAERIARKLKLTMRRIDIHEHDDLIGQFALRIPVIRVNGQVIADGIIEYRDALAKARRVVR